MKFACEKCHTKYSLDDARVAGKILKIRCKTCQSIITVRDPALGGAGHAALAGAGHAHEEPDGEHHDALHHEEPPGEAEHTMVSPAPMAAMAALAAQRPPVFAGAQVEWFVSFDGEQEGPLSLDTARKRIRTEAPSGKEVFCWREGFADWLPLDKVPDLAMALRSAAPARPTPPPATATPGRPAAPIAANPIGRVAVETKPVPASAAAAKAVEARPAPAVAKPVAPEVKPSPSPAPAPVAAKPVAPEVKPAPAPAPVPVAAKPAAPEVKPAPEAKPAPTPTPVAAKPAAPEVKPAPEAKPAPVAAKPAAPEAKAAPVAVVEIPKAAAAAVVVVSAAEAEPGAKPRSTKNTGSHRVAASASLSAAHDEHVPARRNPFAGAFAGAILVIMLLGGALVWALSRGSATTVATTPPPAVTPVIKGAPPRVDDRPVGFVDNAPTAPPPAPETPPTIASGPTPRAGTSHAPRPARESKPAALSAEQKALAALYGGEQEKTDVSKVPTITREGRSGEQVSNAQIMSTVTRNKKSVQICYERVLKHDESMRNVRVDVQIKVGISGMVTGVSFGDRSISSTDLGKCLSQSIKRWQFPSQDSEYETAFPLLLQAQ